jgi:hypothetical protein
MGVIANVAWALSPSPPWHCAGVFANIMLAVLCCIGVVTIIALALSPSLHWRTGVIAVVAFLSLPPSHCRHRHRIDPMSSSWGVIAGIALTP